ncbi:DUF4105 domain-containing protein [bacterium]|nr:DUF4105 domain-containing protein [bacterium]
MKKLILLSICLLFAVIDSNVLSALPKKTEDRKVITSQDTIEIRLITLSPHDDLFAWFGHSALEVHNTVTDQAFSFNFGGFYFDFEHLLQFSLGKFTFWTYALETERALTPYRREDRHIVFQSLNLTPVQKIKIRKALIEYLKPDKRYYQYDHFLDNCSTRIRDIIDEALDGALKDQTQQPADLTFREFVHRMTYNYPHIDFMVMFLMNDQIDKPITQWDSMFLPDRLMAVIQSSHTPFINNNGNAPLVAIKKEENRGKGIPYYYPKATAADTVTRELIWGTILLVLFGFNAIFYLKRKKVFLRLYPAIVSGFGLIFGLLGTTLFFMMCFTEHKDTYWNENILLINPITLFLLPVGIIRVFNRAKPAFAWLSVSAGLIAFSGLILKLLPAFDQVNGQQLRILLPTLMVIAITGILDLSINNHLSFVNKLRKKNWR